MRIGITGAANSWRSRHPQHTKPNTARHPGSRTGVRFVLANPSDPSRLDEFTDWYDTYSAAITVPGYLAFLLTPGHLVPRLRLNMQQLLSFAAVDPPAGTGAAAAKIQVIAIGGGLIYASTS